MAPPDHVPAWPDKVMYAGLLVLISGTLAVLGAAAAYLGMSGTGPAGILETIPPAYSGALGLLAMWLGVAAFLRQTSLYAAVGIVAGAASLGAFGWSSLLALSAVVPLLKARAERERTRRRDTPMHAHAWPDKTLMAAFFLGAAAVAAVAQAMLAFSGRLGAPTSDIATGVISLAVAGLLAHGARQAFHLRRAIWAYACGLLAILSLALVVVGPVMGVLAMLYLWRAEREGEFEVAPAAWVPAVPAAAQQRGQQRSPRTTTV